MVFAVYVGRIWWAVLKEGVMCQPRENIKGGPSSRTMIKFPESKRDGY